MPRNITGIDTSHAVFYAMDPAALKKYADFKDKISAESINLSSEEIKRIKAEIQEARADGRELFKVSEAGTADIVVAGTLEPKPDPCAILFGGEMTTYQDIIEGTRAAEADSNVERIRYLFSTPGGNVVGLFAAADAIRTAKKPTTAIVYSICASAGYALAAQCGTIELENISAEVGSIGIVTEIRSEKNRERVILTSSNAENKRPDVTTQDGRDKIIARMTELESVFIEYVASGRNTTDENVRENYGRGGMLIARKARDIGMIDSIQSEINPGTPAGIITENRNTTENVKTKKGASEMEVTQEMLDKIVSDAATQAATSALAGVDEKLETRDRAREAESKRISGFTTLKNKFPEMGSMIDEEMNKGSHASVDFTLRVSDSDKSRIAAADQQQADAATVADQIETDDQPGKPDDQTGNNLAASLGLKIGA